MPKRPSGSGWEYDEVMLAYDGGWVDELNKLGRAGWRVVSVIHDEDPKAKDSQVRVILERPRRPDASASESDDA